MSKTVKTQGLAAAKAGMTYMNELGITIGGQSFPHMLYHFVLAQSNWEDVTLMLFGEFRKPERRAAERAVDSGPT